MVQKELKVVQINLVNFDKLMMQVDDNLSRADTKISSNDQTRSLKNCEDYKIVVNTR